MSEQDVLPWLDQAVIDWTDKVYRPSAHYLQVFKGAAAEIRRLRKGVHMKPTSTKCLDGKPHRFDWLGETSQAYYDWCAVCGSVKRESKEGESTRVFIPKGM